MTKRQTTILLTFVLTTSLAWAQTASADAKILAQAKTFYQQGRFEDAHSSFRELAAQPSAAQAEAQFWTVKTLLALQKTDAANLALESYLQKFPNDVNREEGLYLRGRILYLAADLKASLEAFSLFSQTYPNSSFLANAYFWMGDSLLSLGKLEEAEKFFDIIANDFPNSFKAEAAAYKKSLISLKYREEDLLSLLTWSHEENIKNIEEFQRREIVYQDAIRTYQTRLLRLAPDDFKAELVILQEQLRKQEDSIKDAAIRNAQVNSEAKTAQSELITTKETLARLEKELALATKSISAQTESLEQRRKLLDAKEEALTIKEQALKAKETGLEQDGQ